MADVGRSSTGRIDRHELRYPEGHDALENYGAWFRNAYDGTNSSVSQPMFRDMKSGYRVNSELRNTYNEDYAIQVDRLMARLLKKQEIAIVFCKYVDCVPSRWAAKRISSSTDPVSVNEYALRLEAVIARVDTAIVMSMGKLA